MKVAISGSSGFIGKNLTAFLARHNFTVVSIPHSLFYPETAKILREKLEGCDVIINLAGVSINQRWTEGNKKKIMDSRIEATRSLVEVVNKMPVKPSVFISASAVGIYPSDGTLYTENTMREGKGFLAEVCHRWEAEAEHISPDVRLVITRFGVVLSSHGGAFPKMVLPFRLFMGGEISSGKQGFSWIHLEDLVNALLFIINNPTLAGAVNMVAPYPTTNSAFAHEVAKAMNRPALVRLPAIAFRLLYGEGEVMVTEGQLTYPQKLLSAGYIFRYPDLQMALFELVP
ncbi:MAG: TIGR01777 family oxidoreductase [Tannerellaceae bacterium]|nr:TIGR01777 family oxidoreductase [Tannerellaceae bacterium]MCD8265343.1 TIGR01777 family oxidoreductase [Tannerellaceae bacterium]